MDKKKKDVKVVDVPIKLSRYVKFYGSLVLGVGAFIALLYVVFFVGASYGCSSGGGILAEGVDGLRCIDIDSSDLCRDYNGRIIEKPDDFSFFELNGSEFEVDDGR